MAAWLSVQSAVIGPSSKTFPTILLYLFPCLVVLASSSKFQSNLCKLKKIQPYSNILASPKAGHGNCLLFP